METSDDILKRLMTFHPQFIGPELARMHRILEALDHPQKKLPPVIHLAGTNGKGSTLATLKAIFEASGKKVHAFISPHLVHYHERLTIAGKQITEAALKEVLLDCETANQGNPITHFEITAAAGLYAFSKYPADVVLLEVGLGGTWDATNVVDHPALSIITPVDIDHQQFLGDDVDTIAREKAGILKAGTPGIIGPQSDEGLRAIEDEAEKRGVALRVFGQDWMVFEEQGRMVFQDEKGLLDLPLPVLKGRHQILNAGTAIAAIRALPNLIAAPDYDTGLKNTVWPARFERLKEGALVEILGSEAELWLDGGHNPHCAAALAETLAELEEKNSRPLYLVTAMMRRKDADGFMNPFAGLARQVRTLSVPGEDNTYSAEELAEIARRAGLSAAPMRDLESALKDIAAEEKAPRVLICGSLYLAGHTLRLNNEIVEA
jgi:dihydrofolate synthase / folylpolyglutamate synthase